MDWKRAALAASALAVTAVAVVTGLEARWNGSQTATNAVQVINASLPAAVVTAKKPTLADIVDMILQERPTAAELTGSPTTAGDFPEGSEEAHVAQLLRKHTNDGVRANRIASALVKEGRRRNVGASLLVGVLLTENPDLDARATSFAGARGLMQVMPFHAGKWGCASPDLFDIESNICHGVAILADNLKQSRTLPQALLGYNGCVRATNTPDCFRYPRKVYGQARKSNSEAFSAPKTVSHIVRRGS
ncbi:MAG: lytic transglycosylase domain-containing protein [Gemmatimonadales bacterium]